MESIEALVQAFLTANVGNERIVRENQSRVATKVKVLLQK
jgi:hypothetical protein